MKKDAYYFPHFSNARNDSKLIKLKRVLGIEGYGIYFMLLEVLREQTDFKLSINDIEDLAYEWHTSKEKIIAVIKDFGLFEIESDYFFSTKLMLYLQPYIEKSERARVAARTRWDAINANAHANALPEHSKSNASKVKESKVKESKVNIYSDEVKNFTHSILKYFPIQPKKIEMWFKEIDLLNRVDKYELNRIEEIIKVFRADSFWSGNFQSLLKLRKTNKEDVKYIDLFNQQLKIKDNGHSKPNEKQQNAADRGVFIMDWDTAERMVRDEKGNS